MPTLNTGRPAAQGFRECGEIEFPYTAFSKKWTLTPEDPREQRPLGQRPSNGGTRSPVSAIHQSDSFLALVLHTRKADPHDSKGRECPPNARALRTNTMTSVSVSSSSRKAPTPASPSPPVRESRIRARPDEDVVVEADALHGSSPSGCAWRRGPRPPPRHTRLAPPGAARERAAHLSALIVQDFLDAEIHDRAVLRVPSRLPAQRRLGIKRPPSSRPCSSVTSP